MKKYIVLISFFLINVNFLKGQSNVNLIPNWSFEEGQSGKTPQCNAVYSANDDHCLFDDDIADWKIAKTNCNCTCNPYIPGAAGCPSPDWIDINTCTDPADNGLTHLTYGSHSLIITPSNRFVSMSAQNNEGIRTSISHKFIANQTYTLRLKLLRYKPYCKLNVILSKYSACWNAGGGNVKQGVAQFVMDDINFSEGVFYSFKTTFTIDSDKGNEMDNIIFTMEDGWIAIDEVELYEQGCNESLYIESKAYTFNEAVYEADPYIVAGYEVGTPPYGSGNVAVKSGANVIYKAAQEVDLEPGFEAEEGSEFLAFIAPCGSMCPPLPNALAGEDAEICNGQPYTLGVSAFPDAQITWTSVPANAISYLSDPHIANPVFTPPPSGCGHVKYILTLSNSCNETKTDEVMISYGDNSTPGTFSASVVSATSDYYLKLDFNTYQCLKRIEIEIWDWNSTQLIQTYSLLSDIDFDCCNFTWTMPDYLTLCNNYKIKIQGYSYCDAPSLPPILLDWTRDPSLYFISITNVLSPDNDGQNETWCITQQGAENYNLIIQSLEWGNIVYSASGNINTSTFCPWNGLNNSGNMCSDGWYSYVVTLTNGCGGADSENGWIWLENGGAKYNISGKLYSSSLCGSEIVESDTLFIKQNGQNIDSISPAITQSDGSFSFNPDEVAMLDTNLLYTINTKNGFPLADSASKSISQWISGSPLNLTLQNVNQEWKQNFSLSDSTNTLAKVLDLKGNVYVAGYAYNPNTKMDFVTLKYTANGTLLWSRVFNAAANLNDIPKAITVDAAANVYITGSSTDYNGKTNYCTLKYDSAGTLKWSVFYDASGNDDEPGDIAVDNQQRVYVSGSSILVPALQQDMLTVSYDSNGTQRWVQRYSGTPNLNETANSIAMDSTNTYFLVCGQTWSSAANSQYTTLKYDLNGYLLWSAFYNSPNGITDNASDVVADAAGNVYVAGSSGTACYSSAGSLKWARTATNQNKVVLLNSDLLAVSGKDGLQLYSTGDSILWNNNSVSVTDLTTDISGNIYVIVDNGVNIRKYDITGDLKWEIPFGNVNSVSAKSIGVSANNNVYVSGNIFTAQYTHILTSKYSQCPDQANMLRVQNPNTSVNNQPLKEIKVLVVPNPNNGTMQVVYNLKDPSPAFFEIYDLTGRKVFCQQLNVENKSITISPQQLNGGVYMYSLVQNNSVIAIDKMVIIK